MRFDVDPEAMSGTAPTFTTAANELATAVGHLRATLSGLGSFWGDDDQGAAFHRQYEPNAETIARATDNVSAGLTSIGQGVEAMAANHATTDAGVASGLRAR